MCCGNNRSALIQQQAAPQHAAPQKAATPLPAKMWADLYFENRSDSPLTVSGNMTGKLYSWPGKGDLQAVDFRDADALKRYAAVLKRVR